MECSTLSKKHDEKFKLLSCFACEKPIQDRFFSSVDGHFWHERCLVCHVCDRILTSSCYIKDSTLFCKMDYWRCFGIRCQLCDEVLFPNQTVYNISLYPSNTAQHDATLQPEIIYFHEKCFGCCQCGRLLHPGERYVLRGSVPLCFADYIRPVQTGSESMDEESQCDKHPDLKCPGKEPRLQDFASLHPIAMENYVMAEYMKNTDEEIMTLPSSNESVKEIQDLPEEDECFELDSDSGSGKNSKRPRTILTTSQRRKFKSVFEVNPKPARKMKKLARRQAQGNTHQVNRKLFPCLNLTQVNPTSCEDTENGIGSTETEISSSIQTAVTESDREKLEGAEFVPNMRSSVVSMERRSTLLDSNEGHFCKYFPLQPLTLHSSSELPTFYSTNNLDFQSDLYQPNPPAMEILERRSNYSQTVDAKEGQRELIEEPMRRLFPVPQNYLPSWCNDYP